ncbi:AsmA family protein [Desulfovibrio sp. JC010]|uniref:AsmA family protein n=1 Tax=Desulfovibrio sp. JC010 TaxID=2593641 RepID=UPI0013D702B2|nr:AsmA family protein [Desulfovibrio sp. JC010]NDV25595.1 AsmA family protein [Desulfovibrio sp. JC010]
MSKAVKLIVASVAGLVLIVGVAMVLAVILINPNDYKGEIADAVRDKTGRELGFEGDLELSVFPWIGVRTGGISLSNAPGFSEKDMFSLKSAEVSLRLLPLITGKVELGNVDVAGLQLFLMRNKKGVTNWDDLAGDKQKNEQKEDKASSSGKSQLNLSVGGVNIQDARVVWDDRQENVRQAVDDCDIMVDGFAPGSPFDFKVHVALSSTKPEIKADINTSGKASLSADFKQIGVKGLSVVVDATGKAVPGGKGQVKLSGDAAVDMIKGAADVAGLVLEAYGMKAEGSLAAGGLNSKSMNFSGDLNVPGFNLKETLDNMGMGLKTADSKALTSVGLNFNYAGSFKSVEVKDLQVNLDETTIKGLFSFANPDRPNIVAQLGIDKINVDNYLPPAGEEKAEPKKEKGAEAKAEKSKEGLLPVELLRKLTLKADLNIKQLIAKKASITDVVGRARAKDGVLTVKPASFNVAKGAFTSSAVVDVRGKTPVMSVTAGLTGLDGANLSQQMTGEDKFSGMMSFNTGLKTRGNDMKTVYANLNGKLGFKVLNGYVSGFDLLYLAGDAFSILTGGAFGKRDNKRTEFGEVSATANIKNGIADNRDLLLKSPLLRAAGAGQLNLNTMKIDYALDTKVVGTLEGQGGKGMKDLVGLTVPMTIKGDVADPSVMVDLPRFAAILAKSGFKVAGSVIEGVGDVLEGIGNTFSGKKKVGSGEESKKNPVQELGGAIKKLF